MGFVYKYDSDTFLIGKWREGKGEDLLIDGSEAKGVEVFYINDGGKKEVLQPELYQQNQEFLNLREFFYSNIKNSRFKDENMKISVHF